MSAQDPELSAALGWPGGISDPVLDRKTLLQMAATMRLASQQALEVLKFCTPKPRPTDDDYAEQGWKEHYAAMTALRAALVQQVEPAQELVAICCNCLGTKRPHADDPEWKGRCDCEPPQLAEPAQELVAKMTAGRAVYFMERFKREEKLLGPNEQAALDFVISMLEQQAEPVEPVYWEVRCAAHPKWMRVDEQQFDEYVSYGWEGQRLYTAPPQRTMVPLTEEEILAAVGWERAAMYMKLTPNFPVDEAKKETLTNARAVEKASWEKNHG